MSYEAWAIPAAIIIGCWAIGRAIERGFEILSNRMGQHSEELNRIGTKLDNLWGPIKGINDKLWGKSADYD